MNSSRLYAASTRPEHEGQDDAWPRTSPPRSHAMPLGRYTSHGHKPRQAVPTAPATWADERGLAALALRESFERWATGRNIALSLPQPPRRHTTSRSKPGRGAHLPLRNLPRPSRARAHEFLGSHAQERFVFKAHHRGLQRRSPELRSRARWPRERRRGKDLHRLMGEWSHTEEMWRRVIEPGEPRSNARSISLFLAIGGCRAQRWRSGGLARRRKWDGSARS